MRPQRINSEKSCSINPRKWQSSKPSKRSRYMNWPMRTSKKLICFSKSGRTKRNWHLRNSKRKFSSRMKESRTWKRMRSDPWQIRRRRTVSLDRLRRYPRRSNRSRQIEIWLKTRNATWKRKSRSSLIRLQTKKTNKGRNEHISTNIFT